MKKNLIFAFISLSIGLGSCDYISAPLEKIEDNGGDKCPDVTFPTNTKSHRTVLLEDYTGHTCTACPTAAIEAKNLEDQYKDSLVVIAVHSGGFAKVKSDYPEDFMTTAGDGYQSVFKFSGWPNGLVNRVDFPKNAHIKSVGSWNSEIRKQLNLPQEVDLQIQCNYDASKSSACISIQSTFLSPSIAESKYKLCVLMVQDHIIAPQLNAGVREPQYEHNHALRANISNGPWGDSLLYGPVITKPIVKKYQYKIESTYKNIPCVPKDCHIVAFVYDDDKTKYRVLQAASVKVIP